MNLDTYHTTLDTDWTYKVRDDIQIYVPGVYDDGLEFNVNGMEFIYTIWCNTM